MDSWGMDQWKNSSSYRHHFWKSTRGNLIRSKHIKIYIFSDVANEDSFLWLRCILLNSSFFWKRTFFEIYVQKELMKNNLTWRYIKIIFPIMLVLIIVCFVFHCKHICSNVSTDYFCTLLLRVKTENTPQDKYLYIIRNL